MIAALFIAGCGKEDDISTEEQLAIDIQKIQDYLTENNITATKTESGLFYVIDTDGTGTENPSNSSTVTIRYRGLLLDGTIFDKTDGNATQSFAMYQLIEGMREGIQLFTEGAEGRLFIPSTLGYGEMGTTTIPANACLIFEIELVSFSDN